MATTGSAAPFFKFFTCRSSSKPFMAGIWMSVSNRSKCRVATRENTSSGVRQQAVAHGRPSRDRFSSMARVSWSWMASSSMSRMSRGGVAGMRGASAVFPVSGFPGVADGRSGIMTKNELPFPGVLWSWISPWSSCTSFSVMESPSPTPSSPCALRRRVNSLKMSFCSSAVMPHPVSSTVRQSCRPCIFARMVMFPSCVNFRALLVRFSTIWRMRKASPV